MAFALLINVRSFVRSFVSQEVKMMAHRIILMRSVLRKNLEELNTPWQWVSVL
jgi:hypothetical protein